MYTIWNVHLYWPDTSNHSVDISTTQPLANHLASFVSSIRFKIMGSKVPILALFRRPQPQKYREQHWPERQPGLWSRPLGGTTRCSKMQRNQQSSFALALRCMVSVTPSQYCSVYQVDVQETPPPKTSTQKTHRQLPWLVPEPGTGGLRTSHGPLSPRLNGHIHPGTQKRPRTWMGCQFIWKGGGSVWSNAEDRSSV